jgi:hypothetical protein
MIEKVRHPTVMKGFIRQTAGPNDSTALEAELVHGWVLICHALASFEILYQNMANSGGAWDSKSYPPENVWSGRMRPEPCH